MWEYFQNLSGTIVAIINLVCIAISPNPRTAAIYYFITALFMLLACFDTYFALPLNVSQSVSGTKPALNLLLIISRGSTDTMSRSIRNLSVKTRNLWYMFSPTGISSRNASRSLSIFSWSSLWLCHCSQQFYRVMSILFKANFYWNLCCTILDIDRVHPNFFISAEYFISLTCFLTFNLAAVFGNILSSYVTWVSLENTDTDHQTCQLTVNIYHLKTKISP